MARTLESTLLHTVRLRLLQDYPAQINTCLETLTDEQIWWRPNDQSNSVANLLVHLSGSNRYYLEEVIAGRDVARNRDGEFAVRGGMAKPEVRALWDEACRVSAEVLGSLGEADLLRETDRTGRRTTLAQVLLHVSHHNAIHTGQILWVTKMLQPGSLDDIGIKMRAR
jgi:uncharacterized damage-inducible protein DinB